jgi:stage V sporulation protein K
MLQFGNKENPFDTSVVDEKIAYLKSFFKKKPNEHLFLLLNYFSNNYKTELNKIEVDNISRHFKSKIVESNLLIVYNNYKQYLIENFTVSNLNILFEVRNSFLDYKLSEDTKLNLKIIELYTDEILSDFKIEEEKELENAKKLCLTFSVNISEFTSILSSKIIKIQNEIINGNFENAETKIELINKYYQIANELKFKYDLEQAYKFINKYNFYCIYNNKKIRGINIDIGFGSLSKIELFNVFNVKFGKIKKSQGSYTVELSNGKMYNFGSAYFLAKTYDISGSFTGESTILSFDEIKEYGISRFNNTNDNYLWYKIKGQRNNHIISNFESEEEFNYIQEFNRKIDNKTNHYNEEHMQKSNEQTYDNIKGNELNKDEKTIPIDYIKELEELIGLSNVKEQIFSLINLLKAQDLRKKNNLKVINVSLHSVFSGSPGTGKTTVARLYAGILKQLGVLKKGHLVEVDRSELVAGYLGQTAIKTEEIINKAIDGVLFIDEAYSLSSSNSDTYGDEAINVLLKRMEDDRDRLVVIVAGYTHEMEGFINSNPGLQSRFNRYIEFEDYNAFELTKIFESLIIKNEYKLDNLAKDKIFQHFDSITKNNSKDFGNGRYVRNLFEHVIQEHANFITKIPNPTEVDLETIKIEHLTI